MFYCRCLPRPSAPTIGWSKPLIDHNTNVDGLTIRKFSLCLIGLLAAIVGCSRESGSRSESTGPSEQSKAGGFVGSKSCRDCHEDFYKLWSTSWHGLAMQPYTPTLAKDHLSPQQADVVIGNNRYRAEIGDGQGWMREIGPGGEKRYPIVHAMGGKNVFYFLTPMERGRLQVLPLAYDVHKKSWYDMAASGVRHFPDRRDEALPWTDRMFAFNTTCFNCHVSQLATRYDVANDTYHTTWGEPGISCESCHGPASEHVRVMEAGEKGHTSKEIKIIRAKEFTHDQMNDMCATCHAKMMPLSTNFVAGDKFFDHYDLITLEHPDFYPDGRDLGENYTFTTWLMSPCLKSGEFDCNHCHTPSGRLRFEGAKSNQMCLPCHEQYVAHPVEHGHHPVGSKGNECVACHMPMTRFAAMGRSDHSMRSPMPASSIAFKSPNACNLCHTDQDAAWSEEWVRKWYPRDYQKEPLQRAHLLDAARKGQWTRLPEMLAEIANKDNDVVYRNSLVRLMPGCDDPRKWPVLIQTLKDPSPLVRSSAASSLQGRMTRESIEALATAAGDESRLVRIRTAAALAAIPPQMFKDPAQARALEKANKEFETSMRARPDDWASYANLGNFAMERQDFQQAVKLFDEANRLEPRMVGPMVNAAIAYSRLGNVDRAEQCLRRALAREPANAAVNFNLGLLVAEQGKMDEAERSLRTALKSDPQMAAAAYNLGVILANRKHELSEGIDWCRKAHQLQPEDAKYAYTLAFYLNKKGDTVEAIKILKDAPTSRPANLEAVSLLAELHERQGNHRAAADVYRTMLKRQDLSDAIRRRLEVQLQHLKAEK